MDGALLCICVSERFSVNKENIAKNSYAVMPMHFRLENASFLKVHLNPKYFFGLNKSLHLFETHLAVLNLILTFI